MQGLKKYFRLTLILIFFLGTLNPSIYAQVDSFKTAPILSTTDSTKQEKTRPKGRPRGISANHSPRTAVLLGLAIPGGGQIYNRRWWKLPIVYGGLGGLTYWAVYNGVKYQGYRKSYFAMVDSDSTTVNTYDPSLTSAQMKLQRDNYQKNFEYAIVGTAAFYILCVAEAFVDAHLMHFDISDDLTMSFKPSLQFNSFAAEPMRNGWTAGLGLKFQWNNNKKTINTSFF